jgi:mono/diheme cytochrome c family protein
MKMKTQDTAKKLIAAAIIAGAFCWAASAQDATTLWNANCAACHGKDGKGQTMMGKKLAIKDLTDPAVQAALTDDQITADIKNGITENGTPKMKAFGEKLTDDQIKALVGQVRSFKK